MSDQSLLHENAEYWKRVARIMETHGRLIRAQYAYGKAVRLEDSEEALRIGAHLDVVIDQLNHLRGEK